MIRDSDQSRDFIRDWERLSRSGKHDMNILKDVMLLLIANNEPLPPEWKDHRLKGERENVNIRECHIKGDLVLVYRLHDKNGVELITFMRAGTHSDIFG